MCQDRESLLGGHPDREMMRAGKKKKWPRLGTAASP